MKKLMMTLTLAALANTSFAIDTITMKTVELQVPQGTPAFAGNVGGVGPGGLDFPTAGQETTTDRVGKVISTASSAVALGEQIYTLVTRGKPSNTTEYAPISIVPKDPMTKEVVSPFDMEGCSMPVTKKFKTSMATGGIDVVVFEYMVVYVYGCSYEGNGKYIQSAIVQPVSVKTGYGWDFNASMKLSGMMNHGTKASPVVGALLTMKYSMNSWRTAFERNDTIHITGKGELKTLSN